ncbi:BLUF domain-containing protein [Pseudomonas sp.]|uniref:BLUF domain-containing protein n=1 Tax=Pseudomonas sp. TaxID=306 RepID=UPI003981FAA1
MIVRLTYASRASHGVSSELIREILDSSQRNNPGKGLTGILCCHERRANYRPTAGAE